MKLRIHVSTCCVTWVLLIANHVVHALQGTTAQSEASGDQMRDDPNGEYDKYFFPTDRLEDLSGAPVITSSVRTAKPDAYLLTWKSPANATTIVNYLIRYKKASIDRWTYDLISPNFTSLQLSNLEHSTIYQVEMVELLQEEKASRLAMSSFQTGSKKTLGGNHPSFASSDPKCRRRHKQGKISRKNCTNSAKAPEAPSSPAVTNTSPTSVSLSWYPKSNGGSPIIGYKLQMRVVKGRKRSWKTVRRIDSADMRTSDITGLKKGTAYKFRVIAINQFGESHPSQSYVHDTGFGFLTPRVLTTAPKLTNATLNNNTLRLQWKFEATDPGKVKGYVINYYLGNARIKKKKIRKPAASSFLIKNLKAGSRYSFKMQAFNVGGTSPVSNEVRVRIHSSSEERDVVEIVDPTEHATEHWDPNEEVGADPEDVVIPFTEHNAAVKEKAARRDLAIVFAGVAVLVIVIALTASCIIYNRNLSLWRSSQKNEDDAASNVADQRRSKFCTKLALAGQFCCGGVVGAKEAAQPSHATPPHCSCCDGASSSPIINDSAGLNMSDYIQSNRTSTSHTLMPGGGIVPCSHIPGSPMYTMVCDYDPCCSDPGIAPLWWVRGADGEFCHTIPHDARPRPKPAEDVIVNNTEGNGTPEDPPPSNSTMITRRYSGYVGEGEKLISSQCASTESESIAPE